MGPNTYPRNIFVASVDPLHFSHLNSLRAAESKFREKVSLVICKNALKNDFMFSLQERKDIAGKYWNIDRVYIAKSRLEIQQFIRSAARIIRASRSWQDVIYVFRLIHHYRVYPEVAKLRLIPVPNNFKQISSTKIKKLVRAKRIDEALALAPEYIIQRVRDKESPG